MLKRDVETHPVSRRTTGGVKGRDPGCPPGHRVSKNPIYAMLLKKTGVFLLDLFEIYIPSVAFSIMFVVFVLQIFFRYFLNHPLTWPYEMTIFAFIWTAVLGACFARRHAVHVVFGLIYDKVSPKTQLLFRLIGNGLIFAAFLIALQPSYEQVQFMAF